MIIFKSLKRIRLGQDYNLLRRKLSRYEIIPEFLWTREQKEDIVEILEKLSELDIELEDELIKDKDEVGLKEFKKNQALIRDELWKLKQELLVKKG